jgi:hypothetical protein
MMLARIDDLETDRAGRSMSLEMRRQTVRFWGLPVISALATILVAATVDPSGNWARLSAMPPGERQRLVGNIQKFDLLYSPEQQRALRDLDRQINELDPTQQAQYLATARRYHNWLESLPENKRDELKVKPPGERLDLIKKLVKDHPVRRAATAKFLQFVDVGDYSPFELSAIYQIWKSMSAAERQQVEKLQPVPRRKSFVRKGEAEKIAAELKRQEYDEAKGLRELEVFAETHKISFLLQELKNKDDGRPSEILRRQAINFHFLERHRPKPVDPERLDDFLASFPPWLQSRFNHHSPDEARRRLTVVYRLVFPPGHEIDDGPQRTAPAGPASARAAPSAAEKRSSAKGTSPF